LDFVLQAGIRRLCKALVTFYAEPEGDSGPGAVVAVAPGVAAVAADGMVSMEDRGMVPGSSRGWDTLLLLLKA